MLAQNTIPIIARVFVDEVLDCGTRAGVDVPGLLTMLDLSDADLDRLSPSRFADIWLMMSRQMGDEFFGLGQRPMAPGSVTLMGHAVRGAKTFDVALRRALRFLQVVLGEPFGRVAVAEGRCTVTLHEKEPPRSAFAYRTFFLILHGMNCWLVSERIPLQSIRFPCQEPDARNDYGDFFGRPVAFGAQAASITFDAKYLRRPVLRSEAELKAFLRTTPEAFLRGYRPVQGLKAQILATCLTGEFAQWPSTDQIAETLGLSKSTLHRRLREEGQSIRAIKQERRRSQATYLLKSTDLSIATIAERVGYAEPSAFHRSFAKWFSITPGELRQKHRGRLP